jgi:DNA-binding response OmpR family regulator
MPNVLIIADHTTGKLIQKYLMREQYSVDQYSDTNFEAFPEGRYDVVVLDASRCPKEMHTFLDATQRRTHCTSFVLLRSMEQLLPDALRDDAAAQYSVVMSAKPIKLSELARLVRAELARVDAA